MLITLTLLLCGQGRHWWVRHAMRWITCMSGCSGWGCFSQGCFYAGRRGREGACCGRMHAPACARMQLLRPALTTSNRSGAATHLEHLLVAELTFHQISGLIVYHLKRGIFGLRLLIHLARHLDDLFQRQLV